MKLRGESVKTRCGFRPLRRSGWIRKMGFLVCFSFLHLNFSNTRSCCSVCFVPSLREDGAQGSGKLTPWKYWLALERHHLLLALLGSFNGTTSEAASDLRFHFLESHAAGSANQHSTQRFAFCYLSSAFQEASVSNCSQVFWAFVSDQQNRISAVSLKWE